MATKKKNKITLVAAALVMAIILILGGTYTWTDYSQHKSNEFSTGQKYLYDVTLVDDFVEVKDWQQGQTVISNIKVKNMSTATGNAYIRLALKEYLEFGDLEEEFSDERYMIDTSGEFLKSDEGAKGAALNDIKTTWGDARYQGIIEEDLVQDSGYTDDGDAYWYVKTKGGDPGGQYGKFLLRTSKYGTESLVAGVKRNYDAYDEEGHQKYPNGECEYTTRVWPANLANLNTSDTYGFTDYISWKLGNDIEVISEWDDFDGKDAKWYLDATTGYAYWGKALEPGRETGSLLESVTLKYRPETDYFYYDVHADMTAVSEPDDISVKRSAPPTLNQPMRRESEVGGLGVPGATVYLTHKHEGEVVQETSVTLSGESEQFLAEFSQPFMGTTYGSDIIEAYQVEPGKLPSDIVMVMVRLPN